MGRMIIRDYFFGVIVLLLISLTVTSLVVLMINGEGGNSETAVNNFMQGRADEEVQQFNNTFNVVEQNLTNQITTLQSKINKLQVDTGGGLNAISLSVAFISTAWDAVKFIFGSFLFANPAIKGLTGYLSIPPWVTGLVIVSIIVFFILSVLSILFNRDI